MWACKKCGSNNYDNSNYCRNCGFPKTGKKPKKIGLIFAIVSTCILISSTGIIWAVDHNSEKRNISKDVFPTVTEVASAASTVSPAQGTSVIDTTKITPTFESNPTPTSTVKPMAAHTHYYSWTTSRYAACDQPGYETGTCTCGDVITRTLSALGHNYVNGICSRCGNVSPNHTHYYTWSTLQEPSCTQGGYQIGTCTCGNTKEQTLNALGHNYVNGVCNKCGAVSTSHSHLIYYDEQMQAPTCTASGYMTGRCICGETVYVSLDATGHSFVDGACSTCGAIDETYHASAISDTTSYTSYDSDNYGDSNGNMVDLSTAFNEDFAMQMQAILDEMKALD